MPAEQKRLSAACKCICFNITTISCLFLLQAPGRLCSHAAPQPPNTHIHTYVNTQYSWKFQSRDQGPSFPSNLREIHVKDIYFYFKINFKSAGTYWPTCQDLGRIKHTSALIGWLQPLPSFIHAYPSGSACKMPSPWLQPFPWIEQRVQTSESYRASSRKCSSHCFIHTSCHEEGGTCLLNTDKTHLNSHQQASVIKRFEMNYLNTSV